MPHPDEQISAEYVEQMNTLARIIDRIFNGNKRGKDREACFVLLLAPFGDEMLDGRVNYISNGNRADVVIMLREILARFEGQPELKGSA